MSNMWRSKLGKEYEKSFMDKNEKAFKAELDKMRKSSENRNCADCSAEGTVWASVNLGVFLCLRCGAIHRGLGTHISVPKGCTGTYLWSPDELESMRIMGNARAREVYGGDDERPPADAADDIWRKYIRDKYELRKFAPASETEPNGVQKNSIPPIESKPNVPTTDDLLVFDFVEPDSLNNKKTDNTPDFFSDFGL